jgi:hypothetical protein
MGRGGSVKGKVTGLPPGGVSTSPHLLAMTASGKSCRRLARSRGYIMPIGPTISASATFF